MFLKIGRDYKLSQSCVKIKPTMTKRGRPTKYSQEVVEIARDYVENHQRYGDVIPSIEGLALVLGVNRDTIYEWKKQYKEFSDTLEILNLKQTKLLINAGLLNKVNIAIAKLLLSKQGYTEKQEVEIERRPLIVLDEE